MKYIQLVFILFLSHLICKAQVFDVDTLRYSGDIDKKINLVILGDGYVENEIGKFVADAQSFSNDMFTQTPFKEYENYFNTFIIKVISNESGVSHPGTATDITEPDHPVLMVDNYFDTTFDASGIHRLVAAKNQSKIFSVLANNFPLYDQVIILANSPYYGGSGGSFPVATTDASANEIAIHELGHSFANLSDEYYAGDVFSGESPNMTRESNPDLVRWNNWSDDFGIGAYQHCCGGQSPFWYRPHQDCKMRYLGVPFCAVCTQRIIEVIHSLTSPLEGFSPDNLVASPTYPQQLKLKLSHPLSHNIFTKWSLNENTIARNKDSVFIEYDDLLFGENEVNVYIEDKSDFLRIDDHQFNHFYEVDWMIIKDSMSVTTDFYVNQNYITIYPNPVQNQLTISGELSLYQIEILNSLGQVYQTINPNGSVYTINILSLPSGLYFVKVSNTDNNLVKVQKIIKN